MPPWVIKPPSSHKNSPNHSRWQPMPVPALKRHPMTRTLRATASKAHTTSQAPTALRASRDRKSKRNQPYCRSTPAIAGTPFSNGAKKRVACELCHRIHKQCTGGLPCKRCISKGCVDHCVEHVRQKYTPTPSSTVAAIGSVGASSDSELDVAQSVTSSEIQVSGLSAPVIESPTSMTTAAPIVRAMHMPISDFTAPMPSMIQGHNVGFAGPSFPRYSLQNDSTFSHQPHLQPLPLPSTVWNIDGFHAGTQVATTTTGYDVPMMHSQPRYNPLWTVGATGPTAPNSFSALFDVPWPCVPPMPQSGIYMNRMWPNYDLGHAGMPGAHPWSNSSDESFGGREQGAPHGFYGYS